MSGEVESRKSKVERESEEKGEEKGEEKDNAEAQRTLRFAEEEKGSPQREQRGRREKGDDVFTTEDTESSEKSIKAGRRVDSEWKSMETRSLCAGAGWAGVVMPPANGLGKLVERVVLFLVMLFLVAPMEAKPAVFVLVGAIALRLLPGEGG